MGAVADIGFLVARSLKHSTTTGCCPTSPVLADERSTSRPHRSNYIKRPSRVGQFTFETGVRETPGSCAQRGATSKGVTTSTATYQRSPDGDCQIVRRASGRVIAVSDVPLMASFPFSSRPW